MRPVLAPRISEAVAQGDLAATEVAVAIIKVVEVMVVAIAEKENLAEAENLTVAAKEDMAAALAEEEDGEGSRAIVLIMVHTADSTLIHRCFFQVEILIVFFWMDS